MFKQLREDIALVKERDPAARSSFEIWLTYSGLHAVHSYRRAHWFYKKKMFTIARIISQFARFRTGIEIHPGAKIGKGLFIDHGMGVVIGETAEIGDNCLIYQGVTLGGTGKEQGKRHPTLGNNIMVGAGAKILGSCVIGDNCKIGAGSVVLKDVPPDSTVVGVPGRVVRRKNMNFPQEEMDQVHLPDPVEEDLCVLHKANVELTNRMIDLERELKDFRRHSREE